MVTACPTCGHPWYRHLENLTTQRTKPGDPVSCWWPGCGCQAAVRTLTRPH